MCLNGTYREVVRACIVATRAFRGWRVVYGACNWAHGRVGRWVSVGGDVGLMSLEPFGNSLLFF